MSLNMPSGFAGIGVNFRSMPSTLDAATTERKRRIEAQVNERDETALSFAETRLFTSLIYIRTVASLLNFPQGKKNILAYAPQTRLAGYNSMEVSVLGDHEVVARELHTRIAKVPYAGVQKASD